jgi:hypothetical protein
MAQRVALASALLLQLACSGAPSSPTAPPAEARVHDPIDEALSLRGLSRAQLLTRLGPNARLETGLAYGPGTDLDMVTAPARTAARVYLSGAQVLVVVLPEAAVAGVSPARLAARFPPDAQLPSRAGKRFEHAVAAGAGVAWSDDGQRIAFAEVFAPTDLAAYRATLWSEPPPAIK